MTIQSLSRIPSLVSLLSAAILAAAGCGGGETTCAFDADCAQPYEYCDEAAGVCAQYECIEDDACDEGQRCSTITNTCIPAQNNQMSTEDMGGTQTSPNSTNGATSQNNTTPAPSNNDTAPFYGDQTPPEVVEIRPDASVDLTPDTTFEVVFNEEMDPISISTFSLLLTTFTGDDIETQVTYNEATRTATITPQASLPPSPQYTLTVTTNARDLAENYIKEDMTRTYYPAFEPDAAAASLAQAFAPIVYQDLSTPDATGDYPVAVDFDGDLDAADNLAASASADPPATVYYQVIQTETYTFITYILYYVSRDDGLGPIAEHDFTGAVFVIDSATEELVLVEGLRVNDGTDTSITYIRADSSIELPGEGNIKDRFDPATLEDGGVRYPLYIPAGRHEACNWQDEEATPPFEACRHTSAAFVGGTDSGVVLAPADAGTRLSEAESDADGLRRGAYVLRPFGDPFWQRRADIGAGALFRMSFGYDPDQPGMMDPWGTMARPAPALQLPRDLVSDAERSFGKTPFQWLESRSSGGGELGQWFIDPAWVLTRRYILPMQSWSLDYCYNLFLDIDRRGDAECLSPDTQ